MATLSIKNIPDKIVKRLKRQAALHRRSLNHEVIACLEALTQSMSVDPEALLTRVRAVRRAPERIRVGDKMLAQLKAVGRL